MLVHVDVSLGQEVEGIFFRLEFAPTLKSFIVKVIFVGERLAHG